MINQLIPQEICLKCLGCCRFKEQSSVWAPCLLDEEIQELLDKKNLPAATVSMNRKLGLIPHPSQDGYICPFFNCQDNRCRIYASRPFECQLYPFLITFRAGKILLTVDLNCPYVKENLKTEEFKRYTDYLTAFLNSSKQLKLLKENPQLIQAYTEVLELIELQAQNEIK